MASLEDHIVTLQQKNFESSYFVPTDELYELLSEQRVREAVVTSGIAIQHCEETISIIMSGARKIFAILILMKSEALIWNFIKHDQLQIETLDAKLPLSEAELERAINSGPAKLFFQKQWMFVSPYFRNDLSYRILEPDVVLPFIKSSFVGRGAFGTVFEVTLPPRHQGLTDIANVSITVRYK
jgi:hypothetical protein